MTDINIPIGSNGKYREPSEAERAALAELPAERQQAFADLENATMANDAINQRIRELEHAERDAEKARDKAEAELEKRKPKVSQFTAYKRHLAAQYVHSGRGGPRASQNAGAERR